MNGQAHSIVRGSDNSMRDMRTEHGKWVWPLGITDHAGVRNYV